MRNNVDLLGWIAVSATIVCLILTLLTIYGFTYISHFDNYNTLEWCLCFTMGIWGVKMLKLHSIYKSFVYPVLCILIAACTVFFILMKVY